MNEEQLAEIYEMVDGIPFSRVKKNISRDFSDGVMMAELIYYYKPKFISLHNYPPANSVPKKIENWNTLNTKVFKRLGIYLTKAQIQEIANSNPGTIEQLLYFILIKFERPDEEVRLTQNAQMIEANQNNANEEVSFKKKSTIDKNTEKSPSHNNELKKPTVQANKEFIEQKYELEEQKGKVNKKDRQDAEEILELVDKIDQASAQLTKLNQMNKLKEDVIRNLEKKLEKFIFS